MDDVTLAGLRAALAATPDNLPLLAVVLGAYAARDDVADAVPLLARADALPAAARVDAARIALKAGDVARARALYEGAVAGNATLEDPGLRERIEAGGAPPRLRVVHALHGDGERAGPLPEAKRETVTFADVGGLDELKQRIRRRVLLPRTKPSLFERFKKRVGGGFLLYGPPGCGKTLIARATAGEIGASFVNVQISDVLDMYVGESEHRLHALFEAAREKSPSVLFFDEVEALGGRRQHARSAATANLVSQFLAEMDGFASVNEGVLVLAATNVPWAVDPAFRRPGRFDQTLFVPPPDKDAREAILSLHLKGRPLAADVDVRALLSSTRGFSGADLEFLVETAADLAIEASLEAGTERPIAQADLLAARKDVRPTTTEWLATARNYARYANESGQYDEVLAFLDQHGA
jgi:ATP-dependent 26S proteasome regulatory subunit